MELFHRFLMDKKHPAPGTGFHRQNYYERNSHCKNVISCINHIELRIFLLSKKFLRKKLLNSIGFKNSLSLKKNPWVSKSSIGFKFHRFQNSLGLIIPLCRMFLPPEAKIFWTFGLIFYFYTMENDAFGMDLLV